MLNHLDRLHVAWTSPDCCDQVQVGEDGPAQFPPLAPGEVRKVPGGYNLGKKGSLDERALLILLCMAETNQANGGDSVDGVACFVNRLAQLDRASTQRNSLSEAAKTAFLEEVQRLRLGCGMERVRTV